MSALRTISLRLRGTSIEVLEEMGEETDGVVESISKLQGKIKALTGVDILTDSGAYKETYTILKEIGTVWKDMSDIDQAALLELMAGKNRANTLAAILGNMEDLEGAYESALNAEGSAMRENEAYLDSIQGRIDLFNNSVQTMWMNFIDSDVVKFIVDLGTSLIKLVDTFGLIPTAAGLFTGYKVAAKELKNIFGETSVSTKTLKKNLNDYIIQQTATSTADNVAAESARNVANARQEEAVATQNASIANTTEVGASNAAAVADSAEASASIEAAEADQLEGQMSFFAANADKEEEKASKTAAIEEEVWEQTSLFDDGVGGSVAGVVDDIVDGGKNITGVWGKVGSVIGVAGKALLSTVGVMFAVQAATWALGKAWEWLDKEVIHRAENIKSEVEDLKNAYNDAKETFSDNLSTLTTSSDTKLYANLEDEFATLTRGVDKYGNNISLTSDQYERYKEICEQIVGINPKIASGYDSATKAIGNNASVLSDLIELQKIQARQNVDTLINDENFGKIIEDANFDANKSVGNANADYYNKRSNAWNAIRKAVVDKLPTISTGDYAGSVTSDIDGDGTLDRETMSYILQQLDYSTDQIGDIVSKYFDEYSGSYLKTKFIEDYYNEIINNTDKFGAEYVDALDSAFTDVDEALLNAEKIAKDSQDNLVDDFLLVLNGTEVGASYDNLNDASQKFINDWIKNSSQFKVDSNKTEEEALASRDKIIQMVKDLASEDFTTEFNGEQITGQDLLNQLYNFDPSTVDWTTYQNQLGSYIETIWNLIGGENNKYGFTSQNELAISLGFNFVQDKQELYKDTKLIQERLDITTDEINGLLAGMNAAEVKAFYTIDWNDAEHSDDNTKAEILDAVRKKAQELENVLSVKTYSVLVGEVESYNEVLLQTSEIVSDNTEVTQEYKDSLTTLGISEEELNECFDKDNKLIVKNSTLLKKLVAQKKQDQKATVKEAKAYGQLQYKNIVSQIGRYINQMANEVKMTGYVNLATLNNIDALREQLSAIKDTIQQYALLELSLSDAANAYSEFEKAKERDTQLTYGDSMVEMLGVINEGFKTGQVGSEAFEFAVKALVPPEVYENIDDVQDKMQAIHDYIDKDTTFADYFTIDEGEISITMDNIKAFLQDGLDDGLGENFSTFTGTIEDFDLAPHIQSIEDLAAAYGITEAAALAMLTEFEKYDASWGDIIYRLTTTELDRNIDDATTALEDALKAQEEFIKSGQPLYDENGEMTEGYKGIVDSVNNARDGLDNATKAAIDNAQAYTQIEAILKGVSGEVKYTQEQADALARSLGLIGENDHIQINAETGALILTQEQVNELNEKLTGLEEPTILDIQLAYDQIDYQIQELEKRLNGENYDANVLADLELTDASDAVVQAKLNELTADRDAIQLVYNITTTSTEQDQSTMEQLGEWETNGVNIVIRGDTTEVDEAVADVNAIVMDEKPVTMTTNSEEANAEIDTVTDNNPPDKTVNLAMSGIYTALNEINSIGTALDDLEGTRYVTIAVNTEDVAQNANGNFHISGGAFASGTVGAPNTETSLVGELGPELIVDPSSGRWHTVGDHGAEFTQVKRGQIIFNHLQTKQLLENGYVTSRGRLQGGGSAFASGTAYGFGIYDAYVGDGDAFKNGSSQWVDPYTNTSDSLSDAADSISDAADEFKEVFDWVEVRLEEIDETLSLLGATLENAIYYTEKNSIIDSMIDVNNKKLENLKAGYAEYAEYASKLLAEVPEKYRDAAQDGAIAIEKFVGEADEATLEAINNYREWAQKAADLKQQTQEVITTIRDLAIQKFDNAYEAGEVRATVEDSQTEKLQNAVDYDEERGLITSDAYYVAMMENSNKKIEYLTNAREAMQKELNAAVEAGQIERGSNEWYELIDQMYQIDASIDEATIELEEFQNAINDLYWENLDQLTNRLDYLKDETQSLIDLMSNDDLIADPQKRTYEGGTVEYWTADDVKWTKEGVASLGLYAQQMEIAEYTARQYAEAIDDLENDYKKGLYSENEYIEKLEELKDAQYENIEAYYDAQDAIVDLNKTRVDSIKDGIEKELDAYEELIEKKKEALDAEKDLYDFQKSTSEQQKNIAQIERQLAALANDTSLSAAAKRKQLEAELAEAQYELQDTYYNRSVEDKQTALDKELEDFNTEKDAEIQKWDEYLTNVEALVAESLGVVQANAAEIGATLTAKAEEYNLTVSDAIMTPWQDGSLAVSDYQDYFDTAMSSTMNQLEALKNKWQEVIDKMAEVGKANVTAINKENANYAAATKKEPVVNEPTTPAPAPTPAQPQQQAKEKQITVGGKINAKGAKIYASIGGSGSKQYYSSDPIYTVLSQSGNWLKVRHHKSNSGVTGWFKKGDVKALAVGTKKLDKSGIVNIDELGEELVLRAQNGRLTYMEKGSGVVPADLTSNLMEWGKLDPTSMLEQNRPSMNVHPEIHNTEINLSMTYGDILHIDEFHGDNPEDISKIVAKQFEKHTKDLNNALRKFVR